MIRGLHVICSYHSYEDAPCPIHSLDIIGVRSLSLRLASNNNHSDDFKKQLRSDIAKIVRSYEKSKNNVNIAVLKEKPIELRAKVSRSSVKATYEWILRDVEKAVNTPNVVGRDVQKYFNGAPVAREGEPFNHIEY